jgi:uncharacterized membrane protein YhaH (DUF805 family)
MMNFDVFISYPHENKAVADAACAKLEAEGIRCWIAPRDIAPSADWASSIVDAIDNCYVMVLIFSAHTNRSKQVGREVQQAFDGEKPVVPFRIENVAPEKSLRYYMGSVHWLDALTPPFEQHLQKLVASVRALITAKAPEVAGQGDRATPDPNARHVEEPQWSPADEETLRSAERKAVQQPAEAEQITREADHHRRAEDAEPQWSDTAREAPGEWKPAAGAVSRMRTWSVDSLWTGRIDRLAYLVGFLLCAVAGLMAVGLYGVAETMTDSNPNLVGPSGFVPAASVGLFISAAGACGILSIRRLHDIGRPGWWSLLGLVPIINYVLIGYLLIKKGAAATNRYGAPPITKEKGIFRRIVNA